MATFMNNLLAKRFYKIEKFDNERLAIIRGHVLID
jgi:hypothetical protein